MANLTSVSIIMERPSSSQLIVLGLKFKSLLTRIITLQLCIRAMSKKELTSPLCSPNVFNVNSAIGLLKEDNIIRPFIQPGKKGFPFRGGSNPSNIKRK